MKKPFQSPDTDMFQHMQIVPTHANHISNSNIIRPQLQNMPEQMADYTMGYLAPSFQQDVQHNYITIQTHRQYVYI